MSHTFTDPISDSRLLRNSFIFTLSFAIMLWAIKFTELLFGLDLVHYGVYPQRPSGLLGILTGPLIHSSVAHLVSNTLPIIILGTALLYGYPRSSRFVLPLIYLASGLGVWLFARHSYHIGASGLTFGMMFFVFTIGALRWDKRAISLAMVVFLLYGSMIWGIFPSQPRISFESHFFGALSGVILAFIFRNHDPAPPRKVYDWEGEEEIPEIDEPTTDRLDNRSTYTYRV